MTQIPDAMPLAARRGFAIDAAVDERLSFIRRTYVHLFLELCGVALVASLGVRIGAVKDVVLYLMQHYILYFALFVGIAIGTHSMVRSGRSLAVQYTAAALWVILLGVWITPLAWLAMANYGSYAVLAKAATITGCAFTGLTAYAFYSRKDFSFLQGGLFIGVLALLGVFMGAWMFGGAMLGGTLGYLFMFGVIVLMAGFTLYDTSKVLHRRKVDEHVAASMDLLYDFVVMFFYIAMLLMGNRR